MIDMRWIRMALVALLCGACLWATADVFAAPLASGMKNPESVCVGPDGRVFISVIGEDGRDGDGKIVVLDDGSVKTFAAGLNDPKGMAPYRDMLFVADKDRVWRIDKDGQATPFAPPNSFPRNPRFLNDLAVDPESGTVFVSDSGSFDGDNGAVFRITPQGLVDVIVDKRSLPALSAPNGLALDGAAHLLLVDWGSGELFRIKLATRDAEKIGSGFEGADGLAFDRHGRLFISNWKHGTVHVIPRPGAAPVQLPARFGHAADLCVDGSGRFMLVPDMKAGTLTAIPAQVPAAEIDVSPLPIKARPALGQVRWTAWQAETESGTVEPLRPIMLTHFADGSNRIVVATQQGMVHTIAPGSLGETAVLLDLRDRVRYADRTNEEGFLGIAFSPHFRDDGLAYVFYTPKRADEPHVNVVSRFRRSSENPAVLDPRSEEVLLAISRPYWNHNGGTIAFGPDGMLYVAVGDGGAANDPHGNSQDLSSLLGKILRIEVDPEAERSAGLPYAVPADNPFVGRKDARPEIWASGLRNVWRLAFDRVTNVLWAADVGQNLYEEINLIERGKNYGWNLREALHPFGARGVGQRPDLTDPIWEYHHDVGKSITGGLVYRGRNLPELTGMYVYADYVTGELFALAYDADAGRVVANRRIRGPKIPVLSFGEDERGELYFLVASATGQSVYGFSRDDAAGGEPPSDVGDRAP